MYKNLNIYLNQSAYYEDLAVELYQIEFNKRKICKQINYLEDFTKLSRDKQIEFHKLVDAEKKILDELIKENALTSHLFDSFTDYKEDEELGI
jgi:hypothetical protein